jgi:hypothetical protein
LELNFIGLAKRRRLKIQRSLLAQLLSLLEGGSHSGTLIRLLKILFT